MHQKLVNHVVLHAKNVTDLQSMIAWNVSKVLLWYRLVKQVNTFVLTKTVMMVTTLTLILQVVNHVLKNAKHAPGVLQQIALNALMVIRCT
jgi:hypothetical protein